MKKNITAFVITSTADHKIEFTAKILNGRPLKDWHYTLANGVRISKTQFLDKDTSERDFESIHIHSACVDKGKRLMLCRSYHKPEWELISCPEGNAPLVTLATGIKGKQFRSIYKALFAIA